MLSSFNVFNLVLPMLIEVLYCKYSVNICITHSMCVEIMVIIESPNNP